MSEESTPKKANCLYITLHLLQTKANNIADFRRILKKSKMQSCNSAFNQLNFDDLTLIHGYVNGAVDCDGKTPKRIKHAWLECGGCVIENSGNNKLIIGKNAYYSGHGAECTKRFSSEEAFQNLMDGYGVSFWHRSGEMQKVEAPSSMEQILARDFMVEYQTGDHGAGCTSKKPNLDSL